MPDTTSPLSFFWSPSGLIFGLLLPSVLFLVFTLVILTSSSVSGSRASKVGLASFHYLMQGVGILLMTIGSLPTLISVLSQSDYSGRVYMSLLWVFLVGGALFLWHEQCAQRIDRASVVVPQAIFVTVVKTMGYLTAIFSALTFIVSIALRNFPTGWWVSPLVLFCFGALLFWSVLEPPQSESSFQNTPLHVPTTKGKQTKKARKRSKAMGFLHLLAKRVRLA